MNEFRPPQTIRTSRTRQPQKPIVLPKLKLTWRNKSRLMYLIICMMLMVSAFAFFSIPDGNIMGLFASPNLIWIILGYIGLYYCWDMVKRATIVPNKIIPKKKDIGTTAIVWDDNSRLKTFGFISNVLAIPFVIMVLIFLALAHTSGTGITVVYWNVFGEMGFETILFVVSATIIFIGLVINFKRWKQDIKK